MSNHDLEKLIVEHTEYIRSRFFGKYRGLVVENEDPKGLGRIRAKVPEVLYNQLTGWALPCVPYAGDGAGQFTVPPKNAGVWIEFEAGDLSRPIWTGCWWSANNLPKNEKGTVATPTMKIIRSEKGLMVTFDDNGQEITLSDDNGRNMLKIKVMDGLVTIQGAVKAVVEAPQIELVEKAAHPIVFGDMLLQYLNQLVLSIQSHTHPGAVAGPYPVAPVPPSTSFPTPASSMNSTKVKSG
jgi:uncharacterized protein involved in type VI secretion and phage assembly